MSQAWVILTRRYGGDTRSPTDAQLAEAIAELYHETLSGMTESDYAEHGTASLRYGCLLRVAGVGLPANTSTGWRGSGRS